MLQRHPLSAAFPDMDPKDFRELVSDIEANGLIQPVVTLDGMILDGWHRYRASLEAGVEPFFEVFRGSDPVAYVISLNMHRRHLTGSQRAAAVVACHAWAPEGRPKLDTGCPVSTVKDMAGEAGVHPTTIKQAKKAQEAGLGEAVRDGKVTAKEAAAVAKLPELERQAALEAPPAPKLVAKPEPSEDVAAIKAENEELKDQLHEMATLMQGLQEELEAARRILDSEDLLAQFNKEVKRAQAMSSTVQSRNNGLMNENADLKGRLKSALRKIERLEKAAKKIQPLSDEEIALEIEGSREPVYDEVG